MFERVKEQVQRYTTAVGEKTVLKTIDWVCDARRLRWLVVSTVVI